MAVNLRKLIDEFVTPPSNVRPNAGRGKYSPQGRGPLSGRGRLGEASAEDIGEALDADATLSQEGVGEPTGRVSELPQDWQVGPGRKVPQSSTTPTGSPSSSISTSLAEIENLVSIIQQDPRTWPPGFAESLDKRILPALREEIDRVRIAVETTRDGAGAVGRSKQTSKHSVLKDEIRAADAAESLERLDAASSVVADKAEMGRISSEFESGAVERAQRQDSNDKFREGVDAIAEDEHGHGQPRPLLETKNNGKLITEPTVKPKPPKQSATQGQPSKTVPFGTVGPQGPPNTDTVEAIRRQSPPAPESSGRTIGDLAREARPAPPAATPRPAAKALNEQQAVLPGQYTGLEASLYESSGLLKDADSNTGVAATQAFPVVEVQVPELDPVTGEMKTTGRLLQGDIYFPREDGNGSHVLIVSNGEQFIVPLEGGKIQKLTPDQFAQFSPEFGTTPVGNIETTNSVLVRAATDGLSPRELADVPVRTGPLVESLEGGTSSGRQGMPKPNIEGVTETPRTGLGALVRGLRDAFRKPDPMSPSTAGTNLTSVNRTAVRSLEQGGPVRALSGDEYNDRISYLMGNLQEFFSQPGPHAAGVAGRLDESLGSIRDFSGSNKLSDLGILDYENMPLDEMAGLQLPVGAERKGVSLPGLPEGKEPSSSVGGNTRFSVASRADMDLARAEAEAAKRNLQAVFQQSEQGKLTGDPVDPYVIAAAEAEFTNAQLKLQSLAAATDPVPAIARETVGGASDLGSYLEARDALRNRHLKLRSFGQGDSPEAIQIEAALEYLDSTYEPMIRSSAEELSANSLRSMDSGLETFASDAGELRRLGYDLPTSVVEQLEARIAGIDDSLQRLNDASRGVTGSRARIIEEAKTVLTQAKASLQQQALYGDLSGSGVRFDAAGSAKFPEGAARELTRLAIENPEGYLEATRGVGKTRVQGFGLEGDELSPAELVDLAERAEAARPPDAHLGGEGRAAPRQDPLYIPPESRMPISPIGEKTTAVQTTEGTMAGMKAIRDYMRSRGSKEIPFWMIEQIERRNKGGAPASKAYLEAMDDLQSQLEAATDPSSRAIVRKEMDRLIFENDQRVRAERKNPRGVPLSEEGEAPSQSETLGWQQMEFENGDGTGAAPGTLDEGFFYRNDADKQFMADLLRSAKEGADGTPSPEGEAFRAAAKNLGGAEEVFIRGYLRMKGGPALEREYSIARDMALKAVQKKEVLQSALNKLSLQQGAGSIEELIANAQAGTLSRPGMDLSARVLETVRQLEVLERDIANGMATADQVADTVHPGLRMEMRMKMDDISNPPAPAPTVQPDAPRVDRVTEALNSNLGVNEQPIQLDPLKDNKVRRVVTYVLDNPDADLAQVKNYLERSGADPATIARVEAWMDSRVVPKPTQPMDAETAGRFATNISDSDILFSEKGQIYGQDATAGIKDLETQIKTFRDNVEEAEVDMQAFEDMGIPYDQLDPDQRAYYDRAKYYLDLRDSGFEDKIAGRIEELRVAEDYTPEAPRPRADMSALRTTPEGFDRTKARLVEGQPFYAAGDPAAEAALFGAATGRFRRGDLLGSSEGLYGENLGTAATRLAKAEQSLYELTGVDAGSLAADDGVTLNVRDVAVEHLQKLKDSLSRQQSGQLRGSRRPLTPLELEKANASYQALSEAVLEHQQASKMVAALEGEDFTELQPTIKTYQTDDNGNGYAVIEMAETVSPEEIGKGRGAQRFSYTLTVPISFDSSFPGSKVGGRRVAMEPVEGGGFESYITEERAGTRQDVDWATGDTKAKRTKPVETEAVIEVENDPKNIRKLREEAAQRQAPAYNGPTREEMVTGTASDAVQTPAKPSRIGQLVNATKTAMKIGGGVAAAGAAAKAVSDAVSGSQPEAVESDEDIAALAFGDGGGDSEADAISGMAFEPQTIVPAPKKQKTDNKIRNYRDLLGKGL